jgi:hypothetical protein
MKGVFPLNILHQPLAYRHVDVFSKTPFSGNGLTVFPESSGLPVETMQRITADRGVCSLPYNSVARDVP